MSSPPSSAATFTPSLKLFASGAPAAREQPEGTAATAARRSPIICFCHLGWDWVWQRPQQFLSRFARHHPVLFVETYLTDTAVAFARLRSPLALPNLTVMEIQLPSARQGDLPFLDAERRRVLLGTLRGELAGQFEDPILWFYDPMAVVAYAGHLDETAIVYDCMDELSQFKGAPEGLLDRERLLLQKADVVFCGGRKMRARRLPLNSNCHFYGTGVDLEHFGQARASDLPVHPDVASLRGPVIGYFGVVDERIDYELLAKLADRHPEWSVVMVGPTAKVDPQDLPRRENLHFIGGRPYAELPALTKGFSVCMMPFALNAATEFINPTKALEYMAAGKPVVSTALDEVKSNFARVARVAASHEEFIAFCEREVARPSRTRVARGLRLAAENTWEAIAAKMEGHIVNALDSSPLPAKHQRDPRPAAASSASARYLYV